MWTATLGLKACHQRRHLTKVVQTAPHTAMPATAVTPVDPQIAVEQEALMDLLQQTVLAFKLALAAVGTNQAQIPSGKKLPG